MPQKRNPDAAELVRGHSGRIVGCLTSLMVTMKGLPLAYSKDMQDDKEPVFEAHDLLELSLEAMTGMVETVEFVPERMRAAAEQGFSTATDLADWLVREAGVPFREAHHITGARGEAGRGARLRARRAAARRRCRQIDARIDERVFDVLSVDASVAQPHQLWRHRAGARPRADREGEGRPRPLAAARAAPSVRSRSAFSLMKPAASRWS